MKPYLIVGILAMLLLTGCFRTGSGTAQDTVYQIQYGGVFWKTYDVWLTNDHPTDTYNAIYCPELYDEETIQALKDAVQSKKKCTIEYHNELIVAPWRCSSETMIDKVICDE